MLQLMTDNPLHRLTIGQRHALRVLFQSRWNYADAAHRLKVSETTVRAIVHRAIDRAGVDARDDLAYWLGQEDASTL